MSTGYQIIEQDKLHFVTFQIVRWMDNYCDVIDEDTWLYDDNYDYNIWRNTDMDAASLVRLKTPEGYIAGDYLNFHIEINTNTFGCKGARCRVHGRFIRRSALSGVSNSCTVHLVPCTQNIHNGYILKT